MNKLFRALGLSAALMLLAQAQSAPPLPKPKKETSAMTQARGTFDVKLKPQSWVEGADDATLGRRVIDKQFHGDLEAVSAGQMLSAGTEVKGSAGYVAIERVTGTLQGKKGSFVLQHNATMNRGVPQLNIIVVPDSGTGELVGLTGTMNIIIADGKHSYEFDYALTPAP